ncbi:hypothetical protein [Lacisediminimonas profundi]|uniref:hypothetical protein n=1 Tax=Lacisediminimonas profundi TaxID=2603856 RepID=UPI00124B0386|nr:hypothetical protein [Lacisediminimonas profundi]
MFNVKVEANELEIPLEKLIDRIIRSTRPKASAASSGGPSDALRIFFKDIEIENEHARRIQNLIAEEVAERRLSVVNTNGKKTVLLYDLVAWTNLYGKLVQQAPYPGQIAYVVDCYKRLREASSALPNHATHTNRSNPSRKQPSGGDSITEIIWEVCYELQDRNLKITAMPVMKELKKRADSEDKNLKGPLMSSTAGGVFYEYANGDQRELCSENLRKRIGEWKNFQKKRKVP